MPASHISEKRQHATTEAQTFCDKALLWALGFREAEVPHSEGGRGTGVLDKQAPMWACDTVSWLSHWGNCVLTPSDNFII